MAQQPIKADQLDVADVSQNVAQAIYPVGAIFISTVATDPATLFGFGTWSQVSEGRTLIGEGTGGGGTYTAGNTGGNKDAIVVDHGHTINDPSHNHPVNDPGHTHTMLDGDASGGEGTFVDGSPSGGGTNPVTQSSVTGLTVNNATTGITVNNSGASGNNANLPPYLVVYIWERTA